MYKYNNFVNKFSWSSQNMMQWIKFQVDTVQKFFGNQQTEGDHFNPHHEPFSTCYLTFKTIYSLIEPLCGFHRLQLSKSWRIITFIKHNNYSNFFFLNNWQDDWLFQVWLTTSNNINWDNQYGLIILSYVEGTNFLDEFRANKITPILKKQHKSYKMVK